MFHVPNQYRFKDKDHPLGTPDEIGNAGAFRIPGPCGRTIWAIASDGMGWEHVSVSLERNLPNWTEMNYIKDLFWDEEDCVIQYHPPKSEYVNNCEYCLHLWRPIGQEIPQPPAILVGIKSLKETT